MKKGYIEWVSKNRDLRVGFITNCFGRVLYINKDWPDGEYERCRWKNRDLFKSLKTRLVQGRTFNKEELMLELL
jgi:hypothetical protein